MKRVIKKVVKWGLKTSLAALAGKAALVVLKKVNKDGQLEAKANDLIDKKGDQAKEIAKAGVAKALRFEEMNQKSVPPAENHTTD